MNSNKPFVFKDTEFERQKAFRDFQKGLEKLALEKFTNADSIRSLEDDNQLALRLWNLPKFDTIEEMQAWLSKENNPKDTDWIN